MMANRDVSGKVVVITGASSGFGKGTALELARGGAYVVLAARREELLEELAVECRAQGGQALAVHTDVSQQADVANLAQQAIAAFGRIDVWINNAGGGAIGRFEEVPLEKHIEVIATDLHGQIYGSYFALQQFHRQAEGGILINVASVIGKVPAPFFASYAAAKHGVVGLSAALRQELDVNQVKNIRVCTVMPASMDTPFFQHAADYTGHTVVPIPPVYEPEQVIQTLVNLVTDPVDEIAVGGAMGPGTSMMHNLFPGLTEHMMARITQKSLETADPAPDKSGGIGQTTPLGTTISGGWKSGEPVR